MIIRKLRLQNGWTQEQLASFSGLNVRTIQRIDLEGFYQHAIIFGLIGGIMLILNLITQPDHLWSKWPVFGWGIGVLVHGLNVFEAIDFFDVQWEKRQVEKRLGRKL